MRARLAILLAALASPAAAQLPRADAGLVVSVRAGYGIPFGDISRGGEEVRDVVRAKIPLSVELGYRFGGHVQGDLYVELAPAEVEIACPPDVSCSASDVRFGLALRLHALPASRLDPWVAVGIGVEVLDATYVPGPGAGRREREWYGLEVPVEAGIALRVGGIFSVGPFLHASFAQFTSFRARPAGGAATSGSIEDRATHGWLELGLRATVSL